MFDLNALLEENKQLKQQLEILKDKLLQHHPELSDWVEKNFIETSKG